MSAILPIPPGYVRAGPLQPIPLLLAEHGENPRDVFVDAEFPIGVLDDSENAVAYTDLCRLLAAAERATRCTHFGLLIGARCTLEQLGLIGLLAGQAPTVGAGLQDFINHILLFDTVTQLNLSRNELDATLTLGLPPADPLGTAQCLDICLAVAVRVLRELAGADFTASRVMLRGKPLGMTRPYTDFFRAPLSFDTGMTGVTFPSRWLDQPLGGSTVLRRHLEAYVAIVKHGMDSSLTGMIAHRIQSKQPLRDWTEESIARSLGMDASSMRRRLARESMTYRQIRDKVYLDRAIHLMRKPELKLTEISAILGFAEPSVFTRAFRRWTGVSPSQWRKSEAGPGTTAASSPTRGPTA